MKLDLIEQLVQLNLEFYTTFASAFAGSRSLAQPSLQRLLDYVPPAGQVLDLGCGSGRIAHLLDQERPGGDYLGLDFSAELIRLARESAVELDRIGIKFDLIDLTQRNWARRLAGQRYDTIFLLAVLHHIPGYENRQAILRDLREHLAHGGSLVLSAWQFTTNARMRRKIVSWDRVGMDPAGLEKGDYLLDWKRDGLGYRYCHLVDETELAQLASGSGLVLRDSWRADGKEGDLSLFAVLETEAPYE